jgi:hypothetical protein
MPNWCQNSVYIEHDDLAMIDRAESAYKRHELLEEFIPVPPALKNPASSTWGGENSAENDKVRAENLEQYGYSSWYDYCVANWGTKWDVGGEYDTVIRNGNMLILNFDSAWGPPLDAFAKLLDMGFRIRAFYWEPGMCFAGIWDNGHDDYYEYSSVDLDDLEKTLPEDLDHEFNIVQSISEWQESG